MSSNSSEISLLQAVAAAEAFRERWLEFIEPTVKKSLKVGSKREEKPRRKIFFVESGLSWMDKFENERAKVDEKIIKLVGSDYRPKRAWLPTLVRECVSLLPNFHIAYKCQDIDFEAAQEFCKKAKHDMPRDSRKRDFYKLSLTGKRFVLEARSIGTGHKRYPLTEWCVIEAIDKDWESLRSIAVRRLKIKRAEKNSQELKRTFHDRCVCERRNVKLYYRVRKQNSRRVKNG